MSHKFKSQKINEEFLGHSIETYHWVTDNHGRNTHTSTKGKIDGEEFVSLRYRTSTRLIADWLKLELVHGPKDLSSRNA